MRNTHSAARLAASVFLVALIAGACASGGASRGTPEWVLSAPGDKDGYMFFVGSGNRGSMADSEEQARLSVTDQIMTFVGAEITAQTDATVKATLDSFRADVTRTVQVRSDARLKSLELVDKWVNPKTAGSVYVLYRCARSDLEAEQRRLDGLVREILARVSEPEEQAIEYAGEGRYYEAVLKYLEAATAAATLDIPNKQVKFDRTIAAARDALGKISILPYSGDGMQAVAGRELPDGFAVIVVAGSSASSAPVPDATVKVSYRAMGSGGRMRTETMEARSGSDGVVSFRLPVPRFVGDEKITVMLNSAPYLEALEKAPKEFQSAVNGIEQLAAQKRSTLSYSVVSGARDVPIGVAVAELDAAGNLLATTDTAASLLGELGKQRFRVSSLRADLGRIVAGSDAEIAAYLASTFGGELRRAAYGVSRISSIEKDGDRLIVKVRAAVRVTDFDTGEIRLSVEKSASAVGSSAEAATASAFRKAGELVAEEIAASLW